MVGVLDDVAGDQRLAHLVQRYRDEFVPEAAAEQVRRAIEKLGYRPNTFARSLVTGASGTVGVLTKFGAITGPGLSPGRHYLWHPWARVAYVVDVTTEIPYTAPVLSSPTHENVPLKSIEFFLRFRIVDAIRFVQTIGAGNFDLVLSNSVQDAIRQRSRQVRTEQAYDLRGSDVKDMRDMAEGDVRFSEQFGMVV